MKQVFSGSIIGGAIGAIVIMIGLIVLDKFAPIRTIDMLSFALIIAGLIITALTLIGGFTIANTWNDIDARTRTIVEKYQRDAEKELEQNSTERQKAIEDTAARVTITMNEISSKLNQNNKRFVISLLLLILAFTGYQIGSQYIEHRNKNKPN